MVTLLSLACYAVYHYSSPFILPAAAAAAAAAAVVVLVVAATVVILPCILSLFMVFFCYLITITFNCIISFC